MVRWIKVFLILLVLGIFLAFAGQSVALSPYDVKAKKVAILPFADYAQQRTFPDALKWGGARRVVAELTAAFEEQGVAVVSQDEVVNILLQEGVIKHLKGYNSYGTPEYEILHTLYSQKQTKELFGKIATRQEPTTALSREKIVQLAANLGVDAIVRGVVLQYEIKPSEVSGPFEGFIPFLMIYDQGRIPCYAAAVNYEAEFYNPVRKVAKHNYRTEFPLTPEASTIVAEIYIQDAANGKLLWRDHLEMIYPDPSFTLELRQKIGSFVSRLCAEPNYGFLLKTE